MPKLQRVDDTTMEERREVCAAINRHGQPDSIAADPLSLRYFDANFVVSCIEKELKHGKSTELGRERLTDALRKFKC
jgi:hypothetical protein